MPQNLSGNIPAVLLTFDDGLANIYADAFLYCSALKFNATVYVMSESIGDTNYLTAAQLQTMNAEGWDIGSHTDQNVQLSGIDQTAVQARLASAKATLDALNLTRASSHVAYPGGFYDATVLAAMAAEGMLTGRTIDPGRPTLPLADNHQIAGQMILGTATLANAKAYIDAAIAEGAVCSLVFHGIVESGPDTYEWSAADFRALIDYIIARRVVPLTISQLYALQSGAVTVTRPW